jgi:hypothetical protein
MRTAPWISRGPLAKFKTNPGLIVAGIRHHIVPDIAGLEGLNTVTQPRTGIRGLGEAPDPLPERARERLSRRKGRQACTHTRLVRWRSGNRNPGSQSEDRQERHSED